jgi:hypothetical protein
MNLEIDLSSARAKHGFSAYKGDQGDCSATLNEKTIQTITDKQDKKIQQRDKRDHP